VDVTVTALDTDGDLLWTDDVPGWVDPTATTPDVMGDTSSKTCRESSEAGDLSAASR
jgi:hypothetical protein